MTYSEYNNLRKGDVVYYVNCQFHQAVIEPLRVAVITTTPVRVVWLSNGDNLLWKLDLCFLNLDEASKRLEELINNQEHKRRKNYDLAPKKSKSKHIYALTTITI